MSNYRTFSKTPNEKNVIRFITSDKQSPQKKINWIFKRYAKELEKESVQDALFRQMKVYCSLNHLDTNNPPEEVDAKAQIMFKGIKSDAIIYVIELLSEISPLLFFTNSQLFDYAVWHPDYLDMYKKLSDPYKEKFAEKVLTMNGKLITSIRHQTSQMWKWAVSAFGCALLIKEVPKKLIKELGPSGMAGIYMSAVRNSGTALQHVPEDEVTPELIKVAFYEVGIGILEKKWFHKLWITLDNTVRTKYLDNKKRAESIKLEKWHAEHQ